MNELLQKYREWGRNPSLKTERLKEKLLSHFENSLVFEQRSDQTKSQFVYRHDISVDHVLKLCSHEYGPGGDCLVPPTDGDTGDKDRSPDSVATVFKACKILRTLLLSVTPKLSWPPQRGEISSATVESLVPSLVHNALVWILTDNESIVDEKINSAESTEIKIATIAQDLLYNATGGSIKTPKHVALPSATKSLTGSKKLVTALSRLGHGIAYTQLTEMEDAMLKEKINNESTLIPTNIKPGLMVDLVFDNNDIQEETLSGKGTTHCTTGIIIQCKTQGCAPPPVTTKQSSAVNCKDLSLTVKPYTLDQRPKFPSMSYEQVISIYIDANHRVHVRAQT